VLPDGVHETFGADLSPRWRQHTVGAASLVQADGVLRFATRGANSRQYSDAQVDDYAGVLRQRFPWQPPLRLEARARFSHASGKLRGTAGFGFWNDPFLMTGARVPTLPRAVWFFYASEPSDMRLDVGTPGRGWKAATIDALRPIAGVLLPLAPLAALLMNARACYRALWPRIQQALGVREALVETDMTAWHTYSLGWGGASVSFEVDGEPLLCAAPSPRGPLGFVMWLDNQYLVVTPWGRFRWGLLDVPGSQWMEVDRLCIVPDRGGC
jgi:hypothetical protein